MEKSNKNRQETNDQRKTAPGAASAQQQNTSQKNDLTKKDIPESTNESKGTMGSGQRQDTN
ncbi:MAG TPA: hypothetical protein VJT83_03965 [Chitinophagaceae bacterium]|nr:hypothetical protein [Chitinophagaceae bacterium]